MSSANREPVGRPEAGGLAPPWHTFALVGLIVSVAVTGTLLAPPPAASPGGTPGARAALVYVPILIVQWGLVFYVARVGRAGNALPALLGQPWTSARRFVGDISLAAVGFAILLGAETLWRSTVSVRPNAAAVELLPHTHLELGAWVGVAASIGFCEEVVYRGYLRTQLGAFTGSAPWGVALQAMLFGLAHAEQGPAAALRVGAYGLLLGALAHRRRSLLPGIACHVAVDLASGLIGA